MLTWKIMTKGKTHFMFTHKLHGNMFQFNQYVNGMYYVLF